MSELRERLERLEMNDQNSKGCSITLGEWLSKENIDILLTLISHERAEAVRGFAKWMAVDDLPSKDQAEYEDIVSTALPYFMDSAEEYLSNEK